MHTRLSLRNDFACHNATSCLLQASHSAIKIHYQLSVFVRPRRLSWPCHTASGNTYTSPTGPKRISSYNTRL